MGSGGNSEKSVGESAGESGNSGNGGSPGGGGNPDPSGNGGKVPSSSSSSGPPMIYRDKRIG